MLEQTMVPHAYAHAIDARDTSYGTYEEMSRTLTNLYSHRPRYGQNRVEDQTFTAFMSKDEVVTTTMITLLDSQDEIRQWLTIRNSPQRLALASSSLSHDAQNAIKARQMGIAATFSESREGREVTFQPLSGTKVILSKDDSKPCGYAVISVHPKDFNGRPNPDYEFMPSNSAGETLADAYEQAIMDVTGHGTQNMRDKIMEMRLRMGDRMIVEGPTSKHQDEITFQIKGENGTRQFKMSLDGLDELASHGNEQTKEPVSTYDKDLRPIMPMLRKVTDTPLHLDVFPPSDPDDLPKDVTFQTMASVIKRTPRSGLKVTRVDDAMLRMQTTTGTAMVISITEDGVALKPSPNAKTETMMPRQISPSLYNPPVDSTLARLKPMLDAMFPEDPDYPATEISYASKSLNEDAATIKSAMIDGQRQPIITRKTPPDPPIPTTLDKTALTRMVDMAKKTETQTARTAPDTSNVRKTRAVETETQTPKH